MNAREHGRAARVVVVVLLQQLSRLLVQRRVGVGENQQAANHLRDRAFTIKQWGMGNARS